MNDKRNGIPVLPTLEYLAPKLYVRIRNKQQCRSIITYSAVVCKYKKIGGVSAWQNKNVQNITLL